MSCECTEHSGLDARLTAQTAKLAVVESRISLKLSRWVFVWAIGLLFTAMFYQIRTINIMNVTLGSLDKNVAVLNERLQNHTTPQEAGFKVVGIRDK